MQKKLITLSIVTLLGLAACAQAPNQTGDYYKRANGKKGSALKTALCGIIYKSSNPGYDALLEMYHTSDKRADGYLRDWYSNSTSYVIGGPAENHSYNAEGQSYNREHSVPQSWFSKKSPMKSDGHHVLPTDGYVNNRRGNLPFGEVSTSSITYQSAGGYSKVGRCRTAGYTGQVFEPADEIKGDIARIYFYMATCYENQVASWATNAVAANVFDGTKYPALTQWQLDMLMRWSKADPVDAVETARNEAVYKHQDNRNPFVDYPGLEEYIWGTKTDVAFNYEDYDSGIEPTPEDPDDPDKPDNPDNPDDPDKPIVVTGETLFVETFDGCAGTGGNDGTWSGGAGAGAFVSDNSGWTAGYMAGGLECARFGSGKAKGTLTSPTITLDGDYVLTFSVAPWNTETCQMTISTDNPTAITLADTSFGTMEAQRWNVYQTEISGHGTCSLIFTPSQNRFFMDEVRITKKESAAPTAVSHPTERCPKTTVAYTIDGKRRPVRRGNDASRARETYIINGKKYMTR